MSVIANTDHNWYFELSSQPVPYEVNFWTPTPWNPKSLKEGDLFLFLLKAPYRKVCGYGRFSYYANMQVLEAWYRFGKGNGVNSLNELMMRANKYVSKNTSKRIGKEDYQHYIGCIVLKNVYFFDENSLVDLKDLKIDFSKNIVKYKYVEESEYILKTLEERKTTEMSRRFELVNETMAAYELKKQKVRNEQSAFRQQLMEIYRHQCSVTNESTREVLEAAHIQPYINMDSNNIQNGIVLRADLHRLFDHGLFTINEDYSIKTSEILHSNNYRMLENKKIYLPERTDLRPSEEAIAYHKENIFRPSLSI
ncbi:HNH endonuclease [Marinococcus halophilus]|uniref:HNH endonuclease n=1 Tax=Marinococcus halophilus TaxID=1371 RepID=UPI0009A71322|nr:HNH endonuclease [Marinococcus halophilus]